MKHPILPVSDLACLRASPVAGPCALLAVVALCIGGTSGCVNEDAIADVKDSVVEESSQHREEFRRRTMQFLTEISITRDFLDELVLESFRDGRGLVDHLGDVSSDTGRMLAQDVEERVVSLIQAVGTSLEAGDKELIEAHRNGDRAAATKALARILRGIEAKRPVPTMLVVSPKVLRVRSSANGFQAVDQVIQVRGKELSPHLHFEVRLDSVAQDVIWSTPDKLGHLAQFAISTLKFSETTKVLEVALGHDVLAIPVIVEYEQGRPQFVETASGVDCVVPPGVKVKIATHCHRMNEEVAVDIVDLDGQHRLSTNNHRPNSLNAQGPEISQTCCIDGPATIRVQSLYKEAPFVGDFRLSKLVLKQFAEQELVVVSAQPGAALAAIDIVIRW